MPEYCQTTRPECDDGRSRGCLVMACAVAGVVMLGFLRPDIASGYPQNQTVESLESRGDITPTDADSEKEKLAALLATEQQLVQRLIEAFPDDEGPLVLAGSIHARHGNTDEAIAYWNKAVQVNPKRADVYAKMAQVALQIDELDRAIELWRRVLQIDPTTPRAHYEMANALMQSGQYQPCIEAIQKEMALTGETPESCFLLGQTYQHLQDYAKAKQSFLRVVKLQPDHRKAYYGLYNVCIRLKQRDEAKEHLGQFKTLKDQYREAVREADESMLTDLECFYVGLANFCYGVHEFTQTAGGTAVTREVLEAALGLGQENAVFLRRLAVQYSKAEQIGTALGLYLRAARVAPRDVSCQLNIGILAVKAQRFNIAEKAFRNVITLAPEHHGGYQELTRLYLRMRKNAPETLKLAQKAVDLKPNAETYHDLGLACLANHAWDDALAALRQAVERAPGNARYTSVYQLVLKKRDSQ